MYVQSAQMNVTAFRLAQSKLKKLAARVFSNIFLAEEMVTAMLAQKRLTFYFPRLMFIYFFH